MLIDWMTLRLPVSQVKGEVQMRLLDYVGRVIAVDSHGELRWQKAVLDVDALRSDSPGLCWQCTVDPTAENPDNALQLVIGGSPASIEHGCNVFGSMDVRHCADVLIRAASKALNAVMPPAPFWTARRMDITGNYGLGDSKQVKAALRYLMSCDGSRQRAEGVAGDSVYWGKGSDLIGAKAYHKGPQLERLFAKYRRDLNTGKPVKGNFSITQEIIELCDSVLRLELMLKARWWRRFYEKGGDWLELTPETLTEIYTDYFSKFVGRVEVADMGSLLIELEKVAPTKGQALSAHRTWALIKSIGYDQARESMPARTWFRHTSILKSAGISEADICSGAIVPFRRHVIEIGKPLTGWADLRRVA